MMPKSTFNLDLQSQSSSSHAGVFFCGAAYDEHIRAWCTRGERLRRPKIQAIRED